MKYLIKIIFTISILFSGHLSAATITWDSPTTNVNTNDIFTVNVVGNNFLSNVNGGGVNILWDPTILNVLSISINETVWDFGGFGISTGTIDNQNGTVDGIMVNTLSNVIGSFDIASIQFQAVGLGTSTLALTEYVLNPWASGGSRINPDFVDASVSVETLITAVPVPAAVWLFGSGLIGLVGLVGLARRKSA